MSNIYLRVTIEKKWRTQNFDFLTLKSCLQVRFWGAPAYADIRPTTGRRPTTLLKKSLWHRCFPVNFVKFRRTPFLTEHLWLLLLNIHCACFSSLKKLCLQKNIKKYLLFIKQKQENSKIRKRIWMKPCSKNWRRKSACANTFLELPLTI